MTYWAENSLVVEQMVADGVELSVYLLQYPKKQKIILIETSWGSILGTKMALSRPDLYYAYLGHSQFVNFTKNLQNTYHKAYGLVKSSADDDVTGNLDALGEPPYNSAKETGQLLRIVKRYERNNALAAPEHWWEIASGYDTEEDLKNRYNGAGHDKLGIRSMASDIDFSKDDLESEQPVYFVQGENDILTASEINKPYFDKISASEKGYILVPGAGHGMNISKIDTQYRIPKEKLNF